jgi:hypothetical protein
MSYMKYFLSLLVVGLMTMSASAQATWIARGTFGDPALDYDATAPFDRWNDLSYEMDFVGGNHYTVTVGSTDYTNPHAITANSKQEFRITDDQDYAPAFAGSNVVAYAKPIPYFDEISGAQLGEVKIHFYDQTSWDDGWFPNNTRRVGFDDAGFVDWEVVGTINNPDWPAGPGEFPLDDLGNGLHSKTYSLAPGAYQFKFRKAGDWGDSIGTDFGNGAGNIPLQVNIGGTEPRDVTFSLDLPSGRWKADVEAPPLVGDYNLDNNVDGADYVMWVKNNSVGTYEQWRQHYGDGEGPLRWIAVSNTAGSQDLTHDSGNLYTAHYTGLAPGSPHLFQVLRSDGSVTVPGSGVRVLADTNGEINLNFREVVEANPGEGWQDGYGPNNEHRLGYEDHDQFDWEVIGSFNNWRQELTDASFPLADMTNGIHSQTFTFTQGTYDFKFRQLDSWDTRIGQNFGQDGQNNSFTVEDATEDWTFEIDLENGRFRAFEVVEIGSGGAVPEPSTLVLALLVGLATSGLIRRR